MLITSDNTRRFIGPDGCSVLAIYDHRGACVLYGPVGVDKRGRAIFVDTPRTYWDDEVEEITWR